MIRGYNVEGNHVKNLSFDIKQHDIVGFYNSNAKKEKEVADLLTGRIRPRNGRIETHELKIFEISENTYFEDEEKTVYEFLRKIYNSKINEKYIVDGMLLLAELTEFKEYVLKDLGTNERYRLAIVTALLQNADLVIIHNLFKDRWNNAIEKLIAEASLRYAIVVFTEKSQDSMFGLPIHCYDLYSC